MNTATPITVNETEKNKRPILWAVNSAVTSKTYEMARIKIEKEPASVYEKVSNMLRNRGYIVSSGSWANNELTDTGSHTRETALTLEWGREIRSLIESGNVAKARNLLLKMGLEQINYYDLEKWNTLLDLPKVVRTQKATGKSFSKSADILKAKIDECTGKWVALLDDEFLGCDKSKIALYRSLKDKDKLTGAMFFYIEN